MKEKEIEKYAQAEVLMRSRGPVVFYFPPKQKFLRYDIFGVFDFMVLSTKNGKIEFYQITTIQHMSERRKKILAWIEKDNVKSGNFYLWAYNKTKGGFKKERFLNEN
jgi:hypothetical protein